MTYDENIADRTRELLSNESIVEERKMFQGICFLVNEKMCVCVLGNHLLCRIGLKQAEIELEKGHCQQMINNGRIMKDFVYVDNDDIKTNRDLKFWIDLTLAFNPEARKSKKKKRNPI